ncbi:hypothetical protein R3P38DRAFT_3187710 [Favolaschia claudopus]|uniref:Uncharacterized protein n=1 Tax=Favolaschia claudopus TaxID=2862362 RepID=A0AAW0BZJ9_9AGAR
MKSKRIETPPWNGPKLLHAATSLCFFSKTATPRRIGILPRIVSIQRRHYRLRPLHLHGLFTATIRLTNARPCLDQPAISPAASAARISALILRISAVTNGRMRRVCGSHVAVVRVSRVILGLNVVCFWSLFLDSSSSTHPISRYCTLQSSSSTARVLYYLSPLSFIRPIDTSTYSFHTSTVVFIFTRFANPPTVPAVSPSTPLLAARIAPPHARVSSRVAVPSLSTRHLPGSITPHFASSIRHLRPPPIRLLCPWPPHLRHTVDVPFTLIDILRPRRSPRFLWFLIDGASCRFWVGNVHDQMFPLWEDRSGGMQAVGGWWEERRKEI